MNTFIREYTSITTPVVFGTINQSSGAVATDFAHWIQVLGAGNVVAKNEDGSSVTSTCFGGEVIPGRFREITSIDIGDAAETHTLTFDAVREMVVLEAIHVGSDLCCTVTSNDGVTLS